MLTVDALHETEKLSARLTRADKSESAVGRMWHNLDRLRSEFGGVPAKRLYRIVQTAKSAILWPMTTLPITIQVPDELAGRLRGRSADLPLLLELGLRELDAQSQFEFDGAADVLEFLAGLPQPAEVLALRPSAALQARIDDHLARARAGQPAAEEEEEWEQIEYLEHLVRLAKARALLKSRE